MRLRVADSVGRPRARRLPSTPRTTHEDFGHGTVGLERRSEQCRRENRWHADTAVADWLESRGNQLPTSRSDAEQTAWVGRAKRCRLLVDLLGGHNVICAGGRNVAPRSHRSGQGHFKTGGLKDEDASGWRYGTANLIYEHLIARRVLKGEDLS